jgi:hypothetical protein
MLLFRARLSSSPDVAEDQLSTFDSLDFHFEDAIQTYYWHLLSLLGSRI